MEFALCPPSLWLGNSMGKKEHAEIRLVIFSIFDNVKHIIPWESAAVGGLLSAETSVQQPSLSLLERSYFHLVSKQCLKNAEYGLLFSEAQFCQSNTVR